jgi:uncharacterized protein (DUF2252 family)
MIPFDASKRAYDTWLAARLGPDYFVRADLDKKSGDMRENEFAFLRATYWRWAEIAPEICPELMDAVAVPAVADIHLENFGTWRDTAGRLVWGVNDFDEAAVMPYALDLARLAASALLAGAGAADAVASAILAGYERGLAKPQAVLPDDGAWTWLGEALDSAKDDGARFAKKIAKLAAGIPPKPFLAALEAAMPQPFNGFAKCAPRTAGLGSLGRARWVGDGGEIVLEAKALVTSAWARARGRDRAAILAGEIATANARPADPFYRVVSEANAGRGIVVRRISADNRKIEADDKSGALKDPRLLDAMGLELAGIHGGTPGARDVIRTDLSSRTAGWLAAATDKAATATLEDLRQLRRS